MKGKKTDTEFLSNFITECVSNNLISTDQILEAAKNKIIEIDAKIKDVEDLKKIRSKLLDVVFTFEKPTKSQKIEDIKILSFLKIQHQHICKHICDMIKKSTSTLENLDDGVYQISDVIFCVKQLLEQKILSKTGTLILRGDLFDEYVKFVSQEK